MIYNFVCSICEHPFEVMQKMGDKHIASHCNKPAKRLWTSGIPQTNKDLMYNFTCSAFGKPVDIHSRRQYKKLLKANGAPDATIRDCLSVKRRDDTKEQATKIGQQMAKEIYDKGAMDWVKNGSRTEGEERAMIEKNKKEGGGCG